VNKNLLFTGGAALIVIVVAVVVVLGRGTDMASAEECMGEHPRRGEWSDAVAGGQGLAVFRSSCVRCHGFTDDGVWCVRHDGDRLAGPVDHLTETTRHDAARIKEIVRAHKAAQSDEGARSLLSLLGEVELDAVSAFVAEIR
jgi:mono/diheme cytochrome c family protein